MPGHFPKAPQTPRRLHGHARWTGALARRKDGSTFPVDIMLSPLSLAELKA